MYIFRQTPHFYPPLLLYRPVPFCGIKFGQPSAPDPSSPKSSQKNDAGREHLAVDDGQWHSSGMSEAEMLGVLRI